MVVFKNQIYIFKESKNRLKASRMDISESMEEYLEALWISEEENRVPAKIKWISERLDVSPPSAVEILKKMEKENYVNYREREGVELTEKGRKVARRVIRNHRLIESLMDKTFDQEVDEKTACGIEHHMSKEFTNALCIELGHPRKCPHGKNIPKGECCPE